MKIQFIIHADFEQPGIIKAWAQKKGFDYDISRPFAHEKIPNANTFDWLIVMGGPQTPLKLDKYPYLQDEIGLIRESISLKKQFWDFAWARS